jgi:hypothetical protein
MIKDDLKLLLQLRIMQLNKVKDTIGVTHSQSYNRSIAWIDSIIAINERLLILL